MPTSNPPLIQPSEKVRRFLDRRFKLYLGGEFTATSSSFETVDPATGRPLAEVPDATAVDLDAAVTAARRAFERWRRSAPRSRVELLGELAAAMRSHFDEFVEIEVLDGGKTTEGARLDVDLAIETLRYYAGWADKVHGDVVPNSVPGMTAMRVREPIGVVAAIPPSNFPILELVYKVAPAIAVGCAVIGKPSPLTPLTALRFADLCAEVQVPAGLINVLTGSGSALGQDLVRHPGVDMITFTGQTETGRSILRDVADGVKKCTLELGGKNPIVVMADADIDAAVTSSAFTTMYNQGQVCVAGSRLLVHDSVVDEFTEKLVSQLSALRIGHGLDPDAAMGPLISQSHMERVLGYIGLATDDGAEVLLGGQRPSLADEALAGGYFVEPTVIGGVSPGARVAQEEIFGPVGCVVPWSSSEEIASIANDVEYGLAAGIFSGDVNAALRLAAEIDAGTVWVNTYAQFDVGVSFGGHKMSGLTGFGSELGSEALEQYQKSKTIWLNLE